MKTAIPPHITVRDLRPLYEAFTEEDDADGNPIFCYSSFGYVTSGFEAFFGRSELRKTRLSPEDIATALKPLSDEDIYPLAPPHLTESLNSDGACYLKGPMLHGDFVGTGLAAKLLLEEAETLEILRQNPHAIIVPYHGMQVRRGRIVNLVFDQLSLTLEERVGQPQAFEAARCFFDVLSAVKHLHSLGLAYM